MSSRSSPNRLEIYRFCNRCTDHYWLITASVFIELEIGTSRTCFPAFIFSILSEDSVDFIQAVREILLSPYHSLLFCRDAFSVDEKVRHTCDQDENYKTENPDEPISVSAWSKQNWNYRNHDAHRAQSQHQSKVKTPYIVKIRVIEWRSAKFLIHSWDLT